MGSHFCYLTMWIGRIGGFILKRIVFISNEYGKQYASRSRYKSRNQLHSTYISRHLYLMRKLYHPHCGYLLLDRQAAPTECVKQSMLLQKYLLFPCASYQVPRGKIISPARTYLYNYHPAPRLLGFHSSSSSPSSSPNALRLRGIFFVFLRFFLPGPRYIHTYMRSDIVVLELSMCRRNMKDKHNTTHRDEQCWVPNSLLPFSKY